MKISLPKDALGALPSPDSQGLVKVSATLKLGEGGSLELLEINDSPVGDEAADDDANPMPEMPDPYAANIPPELQ